MKRRGFILALATAGFGAACPALHAAGEPPPQPVGQDTRCPVCGMYPARYPKWMAQIIYADGRAVAFDSPAELFRYLQQPEKYGAAPGPVAAVYFSDHLRGGWVERRSVFFVHGSSARGPMRGPDLPAFGSRAAAERFARSHGGAVLAYAEVTPEVIAALGDAGHPPHSH